MTEPETITCRRCRRTYLHAPRTVLSACPHCGASPAPLRHHLRHNGLAAVLALIALIVLVVGMVLPFISMSQLGGTREYSLIGGVVELFRIGNPFIGAILLIFSVLFPIVKLCMLLAATSAKVALSDVWRRRLHKIAAVTGKYSLLDLFVVAIMIVLVRFGEFAEVRALPGTVLFSLGVLLSIAAGLCVSFEEQETMSETPPPTIPPPRSRPYVKILWLIIGLATLGTGLYFFYDVEQGGEVSAIKLTTRKDMVGQAAEAVANLDPRAPDLYLKFFTPAGETRLPTFKDTPVGNGLTWNLPQSLPLRELQRIEVWDYQPLLKDSPLDRIELGGGWSDQGQLFHIDLLGQRIEPPKWALPLAAVGAALTLLALLKFVWDQVI